jgi:hypothetical protein
VGRRFIQRDQLTDIVRAAFGPGRRLADLARLRGGSQKGVYRLTLDDGGTAILYLWDARENYWPEGPGGPDVFAPASGIGLFEASQRRLMALGVRTPRPYLVDGTHRHHPADLAVVEDVRGATLEALLAKDSRAAQGTLARLGEALAAMRQDQMPIFGKVAQVDHGEAAPGPSCEQAVLDRALGHLTDAAARVGKIAGVRDELAHRLRELFDTVAPRSRYGLIHGELGPDHVLVDDDGYPVLIDIEGAMFFDVEWEHAFLDFRFGEHYRWLRPDDLDEHRLRFYALALHLSLVAGPLRLLDGDFPDREPMLAIVEYNLGRTLSFLR